MDEQEIQIGELKMQVESLSHEIERLHGIMNAEGIEYRILEPQRTSEKVEDCTESITCIINENISVQQVQLFYSLFKGRKDAFSKRTVRKDGNVAYYPACNNFWKYGICPRCDKKNIKCHECTNRNWTGLTQTAVINHLEGRKEDCSDVIGIYPMMCDETCNFLVFDFDNHDSNQKDNEYANTDEEWIGDVNAMREICIMNQVDAIVERSRSGKGAHVWIFFEELIQVSVARKFGTALLTKGAETVDQKNFKSYDRMIPAQDHMPEGGLGNLIALPLQGQALRKGNSAFIDEKWKVYPDQWKVLENVKKISKQFIDEKISEWTEEGILGVLSDDMSGDLSENDKDEKKKPWEKRQINLEASDADGLVDMTIANQIFIETNNLKPRMQNRLRRLAAFSNPEFYKNQAMGFSTKDTPRIISCTTDEGGYIGIPRGCKDKLIGLLEDSQIKYQVTERRQFGNKNSVQFVGKLYPEQQQASDKMLQYDYGILGAATAFGKTAVGAYLVAIRKVNTLILVHNREIMKNWIEDFDKFLQINEEMPEYKTKSGRIKKRVSMIGTMYGGHNSVTGIIDVVMISSLGKRDNINEMVKDYGMVIMDECHHAGAQTSEEVLKEINARYVYGLTATPKRDDGQEQKVYMQFGPIRFRFTAKDKAKLQGIDHYVYPRFTRLINASGKEWKINEAYKAVILSDIRNKQIISDVIDCIEKGRTPLVLTRFKEHAEILRKGLENKIEHVFLLQGGRSSKERDKIREEMKSVPQNESIVVVAIGQYIGEGLNYQRLDTMMLTTPIAWQGNVEQYAGRLHRDYEGKEDVIIYDYVDTHIRILEKMYHKRMRAYKKIGYEICMNLTDKKLKGNSIFDSESYRSVYENDLQEANEEIIISSPGINGNKVRKIQSLVKARQEAGVSVTVLTLPAESYPEKRVGITKELIQDLTVSGIVVRTVEFLHEHFAIIDKEIVWYGSMNLLSREDEEDNLMRLESKEIAQELLEISFTK